MFYGNVADENDDDDDLGRSQRRFHYHGRQTGVNPLSVPDLRCLTTNLKIKSLFPC
jgi:hypothetical protein